MRFHVPQFLDIEDKIFGPLSFKQFIYLAGGAGIIVAISYFVENFTIIVILSIPIAVLSVALAFYKINQKPFIYTMEAFFKYLVSRRMYTWQKQPKETSEESVSMRERQNTSMPFAIPRMSNSKLKDMEWNVDVAGGAEQVVPTDHARESVSHTDVDTPQTNTDMKSAE